MHTESKHVTIGELSDNLLAIIDRVLADNERILVEKEDGRVVAITPVTGAARTTEVLAAFMAAAGSWHDVDTDRLIEENYDN